MARGCSGGRGGGHRGAGLIEGGTAHEAEGDKRSGQQREPAHDEGDVHAVDESGVDGVAHDVTVDSWRQCGQASDRFWLVCAGQIIKPPGCPPTSG